MKQKISDLPKVEIKQSTYTLEEIRVKASLVLNDEYNIHSDTNIINAILCLANEVSELKEKVKELELINAKY